MRIDAHSHYMPPDVAIQTTFFKQFWSDSDGQLKLMDSHAVDKALLLYPTSDAHLNMGGWDKLCDAYNPAIANLVSSHPDRFIGAGILPVDSPSRIKFELSKIESLGLRVISLASSYDGIYLDDPIFFEIYEFAQKKSMPIHVHSQILNPIGEERLNDPLLTPVIDYVFDVTATIGRMMMAGVFSKFPAVKFVFAHYGGVLPIIKERFDSTYQMLRGRNIVKDLGKLPSEYFTNLCFDMSGSASTGTFLAALEVVSSKNLLWGSDYPANKNWGVGLNVVQNSALNLTEKNNIFGNNLLRLLKIA